MEGEWPTFKYVETAHFLVGRVPGTRILSWTAKPDPGPSASLRADVSDLESALGTLPRERHGLMLDLRAAGEARYLDELLERHLGRITRGFARVAVLVADERAPPRLERIFDGAEERIVGTDENAVFRWLRRPRGR